MPKSYGRQPGIEYVEPLTLFENDAYYKVIFNGTYALQSITNILWYRVGLGLLPPEATFAGAEDLARLVYGEVWLGSFRDAMGVGYKLLDVTVVPFNQYFDPVYNLPFTREVNEFGNAVGAVPGPAACLTARFRLEAQVLGLAGWAPPRRGYVAVGPYREADVEDNGRLTGAAELFWEEKMEALTRDLESFFVWYWPIRVNITRILGTINLLGYTDISGIDVRPRASFRRSRLPEA